MSTRIKNYTLGTSVLCLSERINQFFVVSSLSSKLKIALDVFVLSHFELLALREVSGIFGCFVDVD
jgi:hypothetical protein